MNNDFKSLCCIPARYESSRLPGKPLLKINNKSIIQLVYEQVIKCKYISNIVILTDSEEIKKEVDLFNGKCEIITENCLNGTERIIKYLKKQNEKYDYIINVQGDEPFINPDNIDKCILNYIEKVKQDNLIKCSTLHYIFKNNNDVLKRSCGKLILDKNNNIMYCSRNSIPGFKNTDYKLDFEYYGHIGIFVYDYNYLMNEFLQSNTKYQLAEDIEWMKILENSYRINSVLVENHEIGVDTEDDYKYLKEKYSIGN
jgi:3-deoxy-manno-octulosonate cytidylyltransferase (CMP-KDO synthetase)